MNTQKHPEGKYEGKFFKKINSYPLRNGITTSSMGDFSLEQDKEESENQLRRLMAITEISNIHRLIPEHNNNFSIADRDMGINYHAADAIISPPEKRPKLLASPTGDCPIILLTDKNNNFGAILHVGWRSLKEKIIANTLSSLKSIFSIKEMIVGIFPGICVNCFKAESGFDGNGYFDEKISRNRLNLKSLIMEQLRNEGVLINNIHKYEYCSFHSRESDKEDNPLLFYSHRRGDVQRNLVFMIT